MAREDWMRLLVVEDEPRLAGALKRGLEAEGFTVDVAPDGNEGWRLAHELDYDAHVLDVMLPGMNGFQLCAALRAEGNWAPILMLTAKQGEYDEAEALDTGADDYLSKPFSYVVLVARLRALLRRSGTERPAVLAVGDLFLDPTAHTCQRADQLVHLTPREFSLLEYLLRHQGRAVPKLELLDHVWDLGFRGDPNVVEVYIRYLRRKIDRPFGRHTIETVRGVGYRVMADG